MSTRRYFHFSALALIASLSMFAFADVAVAGDKPPFCVSTADEFYNAMTYWMTSSEDNVFVDLVQGTYTLNSTSAHYRQDIAGGTAALVLVGGFTLSGTNCVAGPINGTNTILDGANATDLYILGNGNMTVRGITIQRMAGSSADAAAIAFASVGNGISFKDFIAHDNTGGAQPDNESVYMDATTGVQITDSLFYNDGCGSGAVGCSALYFGGYTPVNAEIINTTIASNSGIGVRAGLGTVSMINDILWNNAGGDLQVDSASSLNISYSDYSTISAIGSVTVGSGNIHIDPLLNSDYTLQLTPTQSPAINAGASQATVGLFNGYTYPAQDLSNKQRVVGSLVDLGPYESSYDDQHNKVVKNTATSGTGSLADAITDVNQHAGASHITFQIPGGCPQIIVLTNPLPPTNYPLFIDGTTQPGWIPNSASGAFNGTVCVLLTTGNGTAYALDAGSSTSHLTVTGIGFAGFTDTAIKLENGSGHVISGDIFTGGNALLAANNDGIRITGMATNTLIGGFDASATNVIVNGTGAGIHIDNAAGGSTIAYNIIGIAVDGSTPEGNATGISIFNSPGNIVRSNEIGNSTSAGIVLAGPDTAANILQNNYIGAVLNSDDAEPNQQAGVLVQSGANNNSIGTLTSTDTQGGNYIENNGGPGVWVTTSGGSGNSVVANFLYDNGGSTFNNGLAMDLGALGPDANTCTPIIINCTAETSGPNDLQNYPVLQSSVLTAAGIMVMGGTLDAAPSISYRLDFFYAPNTTTGYPGRGNAGYFFGTSLVTTNSHGHASFSASVPSLFAVVGGFISATATSLVGTFQVPQNTSEIGNAVKISPDEIFKNGFD